MPIIINEIEVIAPPPAREQVQNPNAQNRPQLGPTPADIRRVIRRLVERRLRLWAD
jgi:hypothetical protein